MKLLLACVPLCAATLFAAPANADTVVGCQTVPWGFLGSQNRKLCDGPIHPDGSWLRERVIYMPAHEVPITTSCYGSSYVSCSTYGGYFVDLKIIDDETYPVTPDTVLPDEPGHL